MLIINEKSYIEGIDGIDLLIQPYLYPYLDAFKVLDPYNKISIYSSNGKFPNSEGSFSFKYFYYLHISGEYINPDLPIKETIANAINTLFSKGVINIKDYRDNAKLNEINKELIINNLFLFVTGISGIEFCFDFKPNNISIANNAKIIDINDISYIPFKKIRKLKDRPKCLIREGETTYYSYDYKKPRKSTLKLYNREIWLLKKNNEYPATKVKNYPFKIRIEFVLKKNYNTSYLTLDNFDGNYNQIMNRFIPYLAKLYKKYFFDKVIVHNTFDYPFFYRIYDIAHSDNIISNKKLKNIYKVNNNLYTNSSNFFKLIDLLRKESKKHDKLLMDIPDSYYADSMDTSKLNPITPFALMDQNNILFKDDEFTFLKNTKHFLPKFKTIENDEGN